MIFIWLSPLFIAVNVYFVIEWFRWVNVLGMAPGLLKVLKILTAVFWGLVSVCIYVAFFMPRSLDREDDPFLYQLRRVLKVVGNYHLAVLIYLSMILVIILLGRLFEHLMPGLADLPNRELRRAVLGVLVIALITAITLYGVYHASDIKRTEYEVTVNKDTPNVSDLKIVLVADLHLGYSVGCRQMEKMVSMINAEQPDLVVVAGDIFDNEYEALDDPERLEQILSGIESKYGTYAVYGNHDVDEKILGGFTFNYSDKSKGSSADMDAFVEAAGMKLLMDEYVLIDDSFYIYGRPDYSKPGKDIDERRTPEELAALMDLSKPVIVIDHEPRELDSLAEAGVDIDLCGHTHDGQFFPMNLTSRWFTWENSAGLLQKGSMYNIVTSGVGVFGPNIRIGTDAEICVVNVHFGE